MCHPFYNFSTDFQASFIIQNLTFCPPSLSSNWFNNTSHAVLQLVEMVKDGEEEGTEEKENE